MRKTFTYRLLFIVLALGNLLAYSAPLQNEKEIDSLLKAATRDAYENPNRSIATGLSIIGNDSYSKKSKTRALMLCSLGYTAKRDYQMALEYIIKANELSINIDDTKLQVDILFTTGILYQQLKIFDKSIEYMDRIEKLSLLNPDLESIKGELASSYLVKGFIYKDNLNCDIALGLFNKALNVFSKLETPVNHNVSVAHYNKGNCYILLSEYENAKNSFNAAIEYAKLEDASSLISFAQKGLAEVHTLEGEYQEAIFLLLVALDKSKNVGDLILNLSIYKGLFENYLALNQWENYQKYYELFLKTQLKVKISERNSASASIVENSKSINDSLNAIESSFKNRRNSIVLIIFLIFVVTIFIEIKNRKTIKTLQKKIEIIQNMKSTSKTS